MATKQQLQQRLDDIDAILASGSTSLQVDGVTVSFDHAALKNERARIEGELGKKTRKPVAYRVNLGG
ncbi:hypothetical protein VN12_06295 [Pirellula sp. SH-Sr6A]|uniref:hypothetical protein n=1 Tax=Pirellula sp. SH-Sr6A TaxID=1632865 RepID=UPI00078E5749|nr:hypothetical protein [Pirellula sp. SH-Sr6A]AMV31712.1 hypothetical protein VN12_06295 [Pirellula sp. SH-Sr6A]